MKKKGSVEVRNLGTLIIIGGVGSIILPLMQNTFGKLIYGVPIALISIPLGVGIQKCLNWARVTTIFLSIICCVLSIALAILILFSTSPIAAVISLVPLSIFVWVIYFLTRPKVKEQFK
jgi:hypothetical protein